MFGESPSSNMAALALGVGLNCRAELRIGLYNTSLWTGLAPIVLPVGIPWPLVLLNRHPQILYDNTIDP